MKIAVTILVLILAAFSAHAVRLAAHETDAAEDETAFSAKHDCLLTETEQEAWVEHAIKTVPTYGEFIARQHYTQYFRDYIAARHFKALVMHDPNGAADWYFDHSRVEYAIEDADKGCRVYGDRGIGGKCRPFAIGNKLVWNATDVQLEAAIRAYRICGAGSEAG